MERLDGARMRWERLWHNASVRRLAVLFLLTAFVTAGLAWVYSEYSAHRLKQEWLARETAVIARVAESDPDLAGKVAKLLIDPKLPGLSAEEKNKLAAAYGIGDELEKSLIPTVYNEQSRSLLLIAIGGGAILLVLFLLLLYEMIRQLRDVRKLALSVEEGVKFDKPMKLMIYRDGEFGFLAHGVQELSTRLQETIAQLKRDQDFLKDTISDISHQLKTPLASLMIYMELLQDGRIASEEQDEFLNTCRRELERMEWLILTLLKIARLEAGTLPMQIVPAPLDKTIEMGLEPIRRLAESKGITLKLASPSNPVSLPHDARWIAEAVGNLVKNAVEYSPPGTSVTVSWDKTPVFVRLRVIDEGPGVDEKHLPHLFKKFYRAQSGGQGSGVGLGLPLVKSIVERHDGFVEAGRAPEGGSVFTLSLPLIQLPSAGRESAKLTTL